MILEFLIGQAGVNIAVLAYLYRIAYKKPPTIVNVVRDSGTEQESMVKVNFHIQRFTLALEQATDEQLKQEYERNLSYWKSVKSAIELGQG